MNYPIGACSFINYIESKEWVVDYYRPADAMILVTVIHVVREVHTVQGQ